MKKVTVTIIICLVSLAVCIAAAGILSSLKLTVAEYDYRLDGAGGDVRIVFISDVHGRRLGDGNSKLTELIRAESPDIIAVTGDLINRSSDDAEKSEMCALMRELTSIAPTYFSIGNHESDYIEKNGTGILDEIRDTGARVLECEYEDLTVNGTRFRLGGMSELAYYGGDFKFDPKAETFLSDYCDTELPKLMLSHRPEAFGFRYACQSWDLDLILSGHTHGGLIRLPLVGGVVAPIQGFFPEIDYGEFDFYGTRMIVTSGLAGYEGFPRMFNPPEICVVTLTKGQ